MAGELQAKAGAASPTDARSALTLNQWKVVVFCALGGMLETLDIYIIGFVLAVITGPWHLSFGQSAVILLGSGVGALIGSFFWGYVADRFGRKAAFLATLYTCSFASLALALTPEGAWLYVAAWRIVIGFGAGGFFLFLMLVQEFAPAVRRGFASGVVSTATAGGLLIGALTGSFLVPIVGWRGMFLVGALPIVLGIVVTFVMPESPRWALANGRIEQARKSLRWALGADVDTDAMERLYPPEPRKPRWLDVFKYRRSVAAGMMVNFGVVTGYYGMVLWAPTLLAQILGIPGPKAAQIMIGFSLAGLTSRFLMGWLADRFGRRRCGAVAALGAAIFLVIAGLVGHGDLLTPALFWLPFALGFVFADSGFSIMGVYTSEIWPSRLRGRGSGVSYAAGSVGKIIGPLGLGLLIGAKNMIKPEATVAALVPAFVYLACMFTLAGLTYLFVARETRGETLEQIEQELEASAR